MAIEVVNRQRLCPVDARRAREVAQATLEAISRAEASLVIAFVRDRAIRDLNRRHRNKDQATDVLSFPGEGVPQEKSESLVEEDDYLGDVVISTDTALCQAREAGHSVEREVDELVLHGVLHLCGYDHETDRGEMNRLELRLRRNILGARD